ncbi:MAG: hypothetical protein M1833_004642 [Piccolia ochrophora]|nr:MAG: hypothetical protein M1833_004642 [Piccolia ochrophora]
MPPSVAITIVGSLNIDLVSLTSRVPAPGETLYSQSFETNSGGKGANQAVACARLSQTRRGATVEPSYDLSVSDGSTTDPPNITVSMNGAVGDDEFGQSLIFGLEQNHIDVSGIEVRRDTKTGIAIIIVERETGENRIILSPNANHKLRPEQFKSLPAPLPALLVLQLEIPLDTVLQILRTAGEHNVPVLLNPAPAVCLPEQAFKAVTHLILNESEAAILSESSEEYVADQANLGSIAKSFLDSGVQYVVITLGGKGSYYAAERGVVQGLAPAHKAKVVDTTAAGDTFVGAYAVEAVKASSRSEFDIARVVDWANKTAAKTVEKRGAQSAIPWLEEM